MALRPLGLDDLVTALWAPPVGTHAFMEPCPCDLCCGAEKLRGVPCGQCQEPLWGCAALGCWKMSCWHAKPKRKTCWCVLCQGTIITDGLICRHCGNAWSGCPSEPCVCETLRTIRARHRPHILATRIQSLWRGYKTRKDIQERNAEEVKAVLPIWRIYDEDYNRSVLCQNFLVELKKNDPTWDATQSRHYKWMLNVGGPFLEESETYMRRRGWVRPKKYNLNIRFTVAAIYQVLAECGIRDDDADAFAALVKTLERRR